MEVSRALEISAYPPPYQVKMRCRAEDLDLRPCKLVDSPNAFVASVLLCAGGLPNIMSLMLFAVIMPQVSRFPGTSSPDVLGSWLARFIRGRIDVPYASNSIR